MFGGCKQAWFAVLIMRGFGVALGWRGTSGGHADGSSGSSGVVVVVVALVGTACQRWSSV